MPASNACVAPWILVFSDVSSLFHRLLLQNELFLYFSSRSGLKPSATVIQMKLTSLKSPGIIVIGAKKELIHNFEYLRVLEYM